MGSGSAPIGPLYLANSRTRSIRWPHVAPGRILGLIYTYAASVSSPWSTTAPGECLALVADTSLSGTRVALRATLLSSSDRVSAAPPRLQNAP